jgi:hypothetical protein
MEIIGYGILLAIGFAMAPAVIAVVVGLIVIGIAGIASIFNSK